jgi:hypothetical protein
VNEIKNATITDATIELENGKLVAWVFLIYGDDTTQAFGGEESQYDVGVYISRIMATCGVTKWSELKGKNIRVELESIGNDQCRVIRIGHIIKDVWSDIRVEALSAE